MKYHLDIIEGDVILPEFIDIEYNNLDDAYAVLTRFIHSFDGKKSVQGRVVDDNDEDIDYCNSINEKDYEVFVRIYGWASQTVRAKSPQEAEAIALSRPSEWGAKDHSWGWQKDKYDPLIVAPEKPVIIKVQEIGF